MTLNHLLSEHQIELNNVLVLRHRPHEPGLRKVLPWLAGERPEMFNAYQQTQSPTLERVMARLGSQGWVASFIGHAPARAIFVGLYSIAGSKPLTYEQFWRVPAYRKMKAFGMRGWARKADKDSQLWFDLRPVDFYTHWKGRLVIDWPPPERSWWRRAHRNEMQIRAISEESLFEETLPEWNEISLTWSELAVLPARLRSALSHWRGVYFIFDQSDGKGYVGSAYGRDNLLGRWRGYAARGHGGNVLLRGRDPVHFRFSILQRVSPDMQAADVIDLENSWKLRLQTRKPFGLNDN